MIVRPITGGPFWPSLTRPAARGPSSRAPPPARYRGPRAKRTLRLPFSSSRCPRPLRRHPDGQAGDGHHHSPLDRARGSPVGRLCPRASDHPAPPGRPLGRVSDQGEANSPGHAHTQGIRASGLHRRLRPLPRGSETPKRRLDIIAVLHPRRGNVTPHETGVSVEDVRQASGTLVMFRMFRAGRYRQGCSSLSIGQASLRWTSTQARIVRSDSGLRWTAERSARHEP